jgi:hypothetical protein
LADDADFRLECYRLAVSAGFAFDAASEEARRLYEWAARVTQTKREGPDRPADLVAFTDREGGEWEPAAHLKRGPNMVFALSFGDGWIWDPITGWRRRG